jgi:predicted RNase H-like HicB family nuclease
MSTNQNMDENNDLREAYDLSQLSGETRGKYAQRVRLGTNLASFDPALVQVVTLAMRQAHYETLEDGTIYGEIPGFQGVYAQATTEEECREELQSGLEGWIMLGLQLGHEIPGYVVR